MEVVESGVTWVRADDVGNINEALQHDISERHHALLDNNQNPHHATHQELVLLHLFRSWVTLNQLEYVLEKILSKRCDFSGWNDCLSLAVGEEKHSLQGNGGVGVDNKVRRRQVLHQHRENLLPLFLCDDTAESVQILDSVDLQDRVNAILVDQIRGEVLLEVIRDTDQRIGGGNTVRGGRSALSGDSGVKVRGCVLSLPVG